METVQKNPVLAFVLGFAAPGLGLLYVGRALWAVAVVVLWIAGSVGVAAAVMESDPSGLARSQRALLVALSVLSAVSAAWMARTPVPKKGYQHWWWLFGFALLSWAGTTKMQQWVVSTRLGFVARIPDDGMAPGHVAGELIVVDVRRTPRPGDMVAFRRPAQPSEQGSEEVAVSRVIAGPGSTVRVEGGHAVVDDVPLQEQPCTPEDVRDASLACAVTQLGATRFATGGSGCAVAVTSVPLRQVFLLPDARTDAACARAPRLMAQEAVLGVAVRAR